MCSYRIEDDNSIKQTNNSLEFEPGHVSLGHLLYNIPVRAHTSIIIIIPLIIESFFHSFLLGFINFFKNIK